MEVVAVPVVKEHWDGLGRLGRDVAGVAQRPEILPGAVAVVACVVELLLGGLEGREALPAVSGGPVLQLLPPGHADGPSSASPGGPEKSQLRYRGKASAELAPLTCYADLEVYSTPAPTVHIAQQQPVR